MIKKKSGKIVSMASMSGLHSLANRAPYCAAKIGVVGLTRCLAKELGVHNINVNCVCPGLVRTAIWEKALNDIVNQGGDPVAYWEQRINTVPLKRAQTVEDIARVFLFLSSDCADNMTGQAINVTGGRIMH